MHYNCIRYMYFQEIMYHTCIQHKYFQEMMLVFPGLEEEWGSE